MDAVHHITYERIGCENLTDLMAICDPCHEFESGKRDNDPLTDGVRVYLAGSFSTNWRDELLVDSFEVKDMFSLTGGFLTIKRGLRGGFDVTGPWQLNKHSEGPHGVATPKHGGWYESNGPEIVAICKFAIHAADVVFAWLPSSYLSIPAGTLWELGYASCLGKHIVVARDVEFGTDDFWFIDASCGDWVYAETASQAWNKFSKTLWREWKKICYHNKYASAPKFGVDLP